MPKISVIPKSQTPNFSLVMPLIHGQLSVWLSVRFPACRSFSLFPYLSVCLSVCLSLLLSYV